MNKWIISVVVYHFFIFFWTATVATELQWDKPDVVDYLGHVGSFSSIALDKQDIPYISYYDASNGFLKYATLRVQGIEQSNSKKPKQPNSNSRWVTYIVDSSATVGKYAALKVAKDSTIWIAYHDVSHRSLRIAHFANQTWHLDTVDQSGWSGFLGLSLVIGNQNQPQVCYYVKYPGLLRCATLQQGKWRPGLVDRTSDVGMTPSIALDQRGYPRIAYHDITNGHLKYAFWDGMNWVSQVVDSGRSVGVYASLVLDKQGFPHIAYWDGLHFDLRYAYWNGTKWVIEIVDSLGSVGQFSSLALDTADNPRISYFDYKHGNLKFAYRNGNEKWQVQVVEPSIGVGGYNSLVLDSQGNPQISYFDYREQDLKYIHGTLITNPNIEIRNPKQQR